MSSSVEGMDELLETLNRIADDAESVIGDSLMAGAEILQRNIADRVERSNANRLHIKDNIVISDLKGSGNDKHYFVGVGESTAWRAHFLEFGTKKMSARPFVEPGYIASKSAIEEAVARRIRARLQL